MSVTPPLEPTVAAPTTPPRPPPVVATAAANGTPHSHGSASRSHRDDANDTTVPQRRVCDDYDAYLLEDLARNRVYISFESALQNILHVPSDWKSEGHEYQNIISQVLKDPGYRTCRTNFLGKCKEVGAIEKLLYEPQAELYNKAISKINEFCDESFKKREKLLLHFRVNHPKPIHHGIFDHSGLNPDLTGVFKALENTKSFAWPMIVHVEEMKDSDAALDTGKDAPRAMFGKEEDLLSKHHYPSRKPVKETTDTDTQVTLNQNNKRVNSNSTSTANKSSRTSQKASPSTRADAQSTNGLPDNQKTVGARLQCARYLMEMLEFSILRSHAFLTLVDRDHLQLMYADHSSIVTTSIIDLDTSKGEKLFLAMLIAFHRLTPKQWGFLPLVKNSFTSEKASKKSYYREDIEEKNERLKGLEVRLQREDDGSVVDIRLELGDILYHQPGIIGRGTCVVEAHCVDVDEWEQYSGLVVKVTRPSIHRQSEIALLDRARKKGEEMVKTTTPKAGTTADATRELKSHWALNHLPNILHSQDFDLHTEKEPMPQTKLAAFFKLARIINGEFKYEERTLRVDVHEMLYKISDLPTLVKYAQVFYDVLQCHRWLYEFVLILHRDISSGNVMYRRRGNEIFGVLNDLDLSSLREDVEKGKPTSSQRTGTPPYMAIDLLQQSGNRTPPTRHLYRHDLESLAYVILLLCSRNKFDPNAGSIKRLSESLFDKWFDANVSWGDLSRAKREYVAEGFDDVKDIHPSFSAFAPWLEILVLAFQAGLASKAQWGVTMKMNKVARTGDNIEANDILQQSLSGSGAPGAMVKPPPSFFDEETLGGIVQYSLVLKTMSRFGGEQLVDRNEDARIHEGATSNT